MRVVVAMSGGVDSSVAAGLMMEAGHEVIGLTMKLRDTTEAERAGRSDGQRSGERVDGRAAGHACHLQRAAGKRVGGALAGGRQANHMRAEEWVGSRAGRGERVEGGRRVAGVRRAGGQEAGGRRAACCSRQLGLCPASSEGPEIQRV